MSRCASVTLRASLATAAAILSWGDPVVGWARSALADGAALNDGAARSALATAVSFGLDGAARVAGEQRRRLRLAGPSREPDRAAPTPQRVRCGLRWGSAVVAATERLLAAVACARLLTMPASTVD
jgi:hypothetical protein